MFSFTNKEVIGVRSSEVHGSKSMEKSDVFQKSCIHYENTAMRYTAIFHGCKNENFQIKNCGISYLCSIHRLWVHFRAASLSEAVLTSTHNLCFRA